MTAYHYHPDLDYWLNTLHVLDHVRDEYDLGLADSADLDYYYGRADEAESYYYQALGYSDGYNPFCPEGSFWDAKFSYIRG